MPLTPEDERLLKLVAFPRVTFEVAPDRQTATACYDEAFYDDFVQFLNFAIAYLELKRIFIKSRVPAISRAEFKVL